MEINNLCILILSTKSPKYQSFINAIENGWYKEALRNNIKVFFYSGGHSEDVFWNEKEIRVIEDDSIKNSYKKFFSAQKLLREKFPDIKLFYRTNLSSYIDIKEFINFISRGDFTSKSYHGFAGKANLISELFYGNKLLHVFFKRINIGPVIDFYSGSGFFIGVDLCNQLKYSRRTNYLIDDVEIGRQLMEIPFSRSSSVYRRLLITDSFNKINLDDLNQIICDFNLFHYKFKHKNRLVDIDYMEKFGRLKFRLKVLTNS
jgi:hypothetical protein